MATGHVFTGSQIVEMAIQTEQSGNRFYQAAAEKASDGEMRALLQWPAEQEASHEQVFRRLLDEQHREQGPKEEYTGQRAQFIQALLDSRIFGTDPLPERDLEAMTDAQVIDYALNFEKDTILLFYEMRDLVSEMGAYTVGRLIEEEKTHVQRLHALRRA